MNSFIQYIKDSREELLKNVTWPSWTDVQRQTLVVAVATLILSGVTAGVDFVFNRAVQGVFMLLMELFK